MNPYYDEPEYPGQRDPRRSADQLAGRDQPASWDRGPRHRNQQKSARSRVVSVGAGAGSVLIIYLGAAAVFGPDFYRFGRDTEETTAEQTFTADGADDSAAGQEPVEGDATETVESQTVTPAIDGPHVQAILENGQLTISGRVNDAEMVSSVLEMAAATYGSQVNSDLDADPELPAVAWLDDVTAVVSSMSRLDGGTILITNDGISVVARAPTEEQASEFKADLDASSDLEVTYQLSLIHI